MQDNEAHTMTSTDEQLPQQPTDDAPPVRVASPFSLRAARDVSRREDRGVRVLLRDELGDSLMVKNAAGELEQAWALVAGKLSRRWREAEQAANDRMLKRRSLDLTAEQLERNECTKVAACVIEWNLTDDGMPIPCDVHNIVTVLLAAPWVRRDFEKAMDDPSRFLA